MDLRPLADQPMTGERERVWAIFNGEIYNYRELRAELLHRGHQFVTESDTEVIVHGYEEFGREVVQRLRGMFAFAIWDEARQILLLARDRLGIKPLYYSHDDGRFAFASEARVVATSAAPSREGVGAFLRLGWVPSSLNIYEGVAEVPPGSILSWDGHEVALERYWERPASSELRWDGGDARRTLQEAFDSHLIGDVPIALFLSSGFDSALLAHLAGASGADVAAFTVAFDVGVDEADAAAAIAEGAGLRHEVVRVGGDDVLHSLPEIVARMDQPSVDGVNTWVISRAVAQAGLKVALSGLGGDELLGGYSTFRRAPQLAAASRGVSLLPLGLRTALSSKASDRLRSHLAQRAIEALAVGGLTGAYGAMRSTLSEPVVGMLLRRPAPTQSEILASTERAGAEGVRQLEFANYLPSQLLRDSDVMSMAHSLELRVPLLDDRMVEYTLQRPVIGKTELARLVAPELAAVAEAPKQTFTLPFDRWLRSDLEATALQSIARLAEDDVGLDRWELSRLWDRWRAGRLHWRSIWTLTVLGLWVDR